MVIPIHDQNPLRRRPVVTYALIAANVVVFVISPIANLLGDDGQGLRHACAVHQFLEDYGAVPRELVTNHSLPEQQLAVTNPATGATFTCPVDNFDTPPALSVLTAMFIHGGWAHLLGNMLFLLIFGNNIEDRMGRLRYLLFYLVAGYVASYGFAFTYPASTTTLVGASGAIAGVLGAYLVAYPRARVISLVPFLLFLPLRLPAWLVLGLWFLLQWVYFQGYGVASQAGVAYAAHVYGFIFGLLLALLVLRRPPPRPPRPAPYRWREPPWR